MSNVPQKWQWLLEQNGLPLLVTEALRHYGKVEGSGTSNNSEIIAWADEVGMVTSSRYDDWAADFYNKDSIPWCGLFMALCTARTSGGNKARMPVNKYLAALSWADWGEAVQYKIKGQNHFRLVWLGDIAVFTRSGGGHVGIVIGFSKDGKYIYVLGGNQSNAVNITKIETRRLYAVRRPKYSVRPAGAQHFRLNVSGTVSSNEA
jgi:uncharacterized protein (TIGR02594 family)